MTSAWLLAVALAATPAPKPRLAVIVVVDQLGSADLEALEWAGHADFGGLAARGAARFDAWYGALCTETGPGHATVSTGAEPSTHGICANDWYVDGRPTYCVADAEAPVLGLADGPGRSAHFLAAPTLGDTLKTRSPASRVVAISVKDRAAILLGGRSADVVLWYEPQLGRFTTGAAWATALPAWAEPLAALPQRAFSEARWSPLPGGIAARLEDARPGEGAPDGFGPVFPHDLKALPEAKRPKAYRLTPSSVEDVFRLGRAALDGEQLGRRGVPDLLWLSISATDYAGHNWGPGSAEKVDLLERTSAELRSFTRLLDARLGRDGWVLAVTGDHGAAPLPEVAAHARLPSGRVRSDQLVRAARSGLTAALAPRVLGANAPNVFLDERGLSAAERERLRAAVTAGLGQVVGVQLPEPDAPLTAHSRFGDRCGAALFDLAPYYVFGGDGYTTGVDHASGNAYDRRVPLFFLAPGLPAVRSSAPLAVKDVAPSVAAALGLPPPDRSDGVPLQQRFEPSRNRP